mgnify:FL=1|jgi:hypothetical protein
MPLQNRVSPNGDIIATSQRGMFMGNRGILHNDEKELVSTSKIKGWVTCRLEFKGRKRELMAKGRYTELFFFDEATAFAAGHRPCAECRRERYKEFKSKWLEANGTLLDGDSTAIGAIDKIIHAQRIHKQKKVTYQALLNSLPDGVIVTIDSENYLIWKEKLFLWSFDGYKLSNLTIDDREVSVLTPHSYVEMFKQGFVPMVHASIEELE